MDLEACEAIFAQKLACGEPATRRRALTRLRSWLKSSSSGGKTLSLADLQRVSKGLHSALWMQDKMLDQEELADAIVDLLSAFAGGEEQRAVFVRAMLDVLSREWPMIDRWRMDKFLMLARKLLRGVFVRLRDRAWQQETIDLYFAVFADTLFSPDRAFSEGLKFHFASVYLDELDATGDVPPSLVSSLLRPYAQLLSQSQITNYLFDAVVEEVFVTILHHHSEELAAGEEDADGDKAALEFDYDQLGEMLFDIAKAPHIRSDRRKRLYAIVKKFQLAAKGGDVFASSDEDMQDADGMSKRQINNAAQRLLKVTMTGKRRRRRRNHGEKSIAEKKGAIVKKKPVRRQRK